MRSEFSQKSSAASEQVLGNVRILGINPPRFVWAGSGAPVENEPFAATSKAHPDISLLASKIPFARPALPREKISGPLSPVSDPTDETIFEEAAKPETKYYLPRYRVAEQLVSGKAQFRVKLEQTAHGGTLTVFLEAYPTPKLESVARQATVIPHSIALKLIARIPMGTSQIQQELIFQEITKEGTLFKAVLRLEQLAQLTQVYQVLTQVSFAASLVILRSTKVALPVPVNNSAQIQQLNSQIQKVQREINELNKQITALDVRRRQLEKVARTNPAARNLLQKLRVQLNNLNAQRVAKTNELKQKTTQLATLQKQKLFRVTVRVINSAIAPSPFVFARELHPYIFGDVIPTGGERIGFVLRQVVWKERSHTYYQQNLEPHRFHFLPDSFKVARRPETPHYPLIAVRFPNPDAAPEVMPVTLEYVAVPFFETERLQAAATEMKSKLPELANSDRQIEFEPLLCDAAQLFLTVPRGESGPQREERKAAKIDLRTGILDAVTLPMSDFQGLFDALFGASAVIFQGEVIIDIDSAQGIPAEKIPVICRLADLVGDLFDITIEQDASSKTVRATLRNAIESPVEIHGLKAILARGNSKANGIIEGLSFATPLTVPAKAAVSCAISPASPLSGNGEVAVELDLGQTIVQPNSEAVWEVVVDQTRLPEFNRTIKVKTIKQTFDPKPDQPSDPIVAVVVDFERGDSVELNADKLEADAKVRLSLDDYVIRRLDNGQYRYAVTIIRASGQSKDSEWRTDRVGILFPPINQVVSTPH